MAVRKKKDETASKPTGTTSRQRTIKPLPSDDAIARRAYELFIRRGGEHGRDIEDWLLAKRELSAGV